MKEEKIFDSVFIFCGLNHPHEHRKFMLLFKKKKKESISSFYFEGGIGADDDLLVYERLFLSVME